MTWTPLKRWCRDSGQYGLNIAATEYTTTGTRLIRTSDIEEDGTLKDFGVVYVDPEEVGTVHSLKPGDLLFSRSGSLGKCLEYTSEMPSATFAGYLVRFRPTTRENSRYMSYVAQSAFFQQRIEAEAVSSTIANFNAQRYALLQLPWWESSRQQAIADHLDRETARIDTLIAKKQQLIALFEEQRLVMIDTEVASAGGSNRSLKHCSVVRVSNVDKKVYDGEIPVRLINYTDVSYGDRLRPSEELMAATASPQQIRQFRLQPGDVIITKDSETPEDIGLAAFVEESADDLVCGYHLAVIRPDKSKVDGRFLCYVMRTKQMREYLALRAKGVTRFGLRLDEIRSASCQFPDLATQREIATRLDRYGTKVESVVGRQKKSIDLLRELRQALITAAVTGELEVAA